MGETPLQAAHQVIGQPLFLRTEGECIPFRAIHVVDAHKGRLATHGEPAIFSLERVVHRMAQFLDLVPLLFAIRHGDSR